MGCRLGLLCMCLVCCHNDSSSPSCSGSCQSGWHCCQCRMHSRQSLHDRHYYVYVLFAHAWLIFLLLKRVGYVGHSAGQTRNCAGFFACSQRRTLLQLKAMHNAFSYMPSYNACACGRDDDQQAFDGHGMWSVCKHCFCMHAWFRSLE